MARSVCVWIFVCGFAASAAAQDGSDPSRGPELPLSLRAAADVPAPQLAVPAGWSRARDTRPSALVPLYVSFAALEAMDYASTTRALASGAAGEANPVMTGMVGHRAAFLALKAGTAVGAIALTERLRKGHPRRAIVFMTALNALMASVVGHNFAVSSSF